MPIKLNFEGVSAAGTFEPWPVREELNFNIFNISQEVGKESREPYLKFEFKQVGSNRKAWRNYSLQANSLSFLKRLLVDLEYDEEALEGDFDFDPADILGREVIITFGPEKTDKNGRKSQEIVTVSAV